jgi:hypothetical protein
VPPVLKETGDGKRTAVVPRKELHVHVGEFAVGAVEGEPLARVNAQQVTERGLARGYRPVVADLGLSRMLRQPEEPGSLS